MYSKFANDISLMNQRYGLGSIPTSDWSIVEKRLEQFNDILSKECNEIEDIQELAGEAGDTNWPELQKEIIVNLADLLGDIIVYCASEAQRWGIPLPQVLQIIMASNTSKLGADGLPIINKENGKFEKGPNYWKPEAAIAHLLKYGGNGMVFNTTEAGVTTVEMWEPQTPEVRDTMQQFGTPGEEH